MSRVEIRAGCAGSMMIAIRFAPVATRLAACTTIQIPDRPRTLAIATWPPSSRLTALRKALAATDFTQVRKPALDPWSDRLHLEVGVEYDQPGSARAVRVDRLSHEQRPPGAFGEAG